MGPNLEELLKPWPVLTLIQSPIRHKQILKIYVYISDRLVTNDH